MIRFGRTSQPPDREGTLALRPAANAVPAKTLYFATDDNGGKLYRSDGASWLPVSPGVTELPGSAPLAVAKSTVAFTTTSVYPTFVDVTGYTGATFTFPASGVVEAKITPAMSHSVAGKLAVFQVVDGSNAIQWDGVALSAIATGSTGPTPYAKEITGTPGASTTFRLQVCGNSAGTTTVGNGITKFGGALKITASG